MVLPPPKAAVVPARAAVSWPKERQGKAATSSSVRAGAHEGWVMGYRLGESGTRIQCTSNALRQTESRSAPFPVPWHFPPRGLVKCWSAVWTDRGVYEA